MTAEMLLNNGLGVAVVVGLAVGIFRVGKFASSEVWPWWTSRDHEERERQHEQELRRGDASSAMAAHLSVIAHTMTHVLEYCIDRKDTDPG